MSLHLKKNIKSFHNTLPQVLYKRTILITDSHVLVPGLFRVRISCSFLTKYYSIGAIYITNYHPPTIGEECGTRILTCHIIPKRQLNHAPGLAFKCMSRHEDKVKLHNSVPLYCTNKTCKVSKKWIFRGSLASQSCHIKTHATVTNLTVFSKVKIPLHNPLSIVQCIHTITYNIPVNFDTRYLLK